MDAQLLLQSQQGDKKSIARVISLIENEAQIDIVPSDRPVPVIGITGPPGAGKSTLTDALIDEYIKDGKRVAVLCVDPSSVLHQGAILGDRIRMNRWFNHEKVFIRSLSSRGSMGGLHPQIDKIKFFLQSCPFDLILIETVGVGQSEIEIIKHADKTILVLVPEAGDEIQLMKSGIVEVADLFVVNKSDRPGSDFFVAQLSNMLKSKSSSKKVCATVATKGDGVVGLKKMIDDLL
jgi:LAO/AO transport system kinase